MLRLSYFCSYFCRRFKFQNFVSNGGIDLTMLCSSVRDVAIITLRLVDYRSVIHDISKPKAIHLLGTSVLEDRGYI